MNNEWITDRLPDSSEITNEGDVWVYDVDTDEYYIRNYQVLVLGEPWREIDPPPSYVKLKRYGVRETYYPGSGKFAVYQTKDGLTCSSYLPTREAAERIAAIYEEVMP